VARIPYFDLKQASPELAELVGSRPPLNIYRMIAHGGDVAVGFLQLGGAILRKSELDARLRELVILRTGALCGSSYETYQHRRVAAAAGVPQQKIEAVLDASGKLITSEVFDPLELQLLRFTDEVVRDVKASDESFRQVSEAFSHRQLVEIQLTIGFYMMVSRFLENMEVEIE
jgi:4-carboxymuconolactone decarboxylase